MLDLVSLEDNKRTVLCDSRWRKLCRPCRRIWRAPQARRFFSVKLNRSVFSLHFGRSPNESRRFACEFRSAFFPPLLWNVFIIVKTFVHVWVGERYTRFPRLPSCGLQISVNQCPANPSSPLPHALRNESVEVCLFTRDEPNMTADQTERFYKKLLTQSGVKFMPQVCRAVKCGVNWHSSKPCPLSVVDLGKSSARGTQSLSRRAPVTVAARPYNLWNIP